MCKLEQVVCCTLKSKGPCSTHQINFTILTCITVEHIYLYININVTELRVHVKEWLEDVSLQKNVMHQHHNEDQQSASTLPHSKTILLNDSNHEPYFMFYAYNWSDANLTFYYLMLSVCIPYIALQCSSIENVHIHNIYTQGVESWLFSLVLVPFTCCMLVIFFILLRCWWLNYMGHDGIVKLSTT